MRRVPEMSMYQDDGPDEIKKQMAQVGLKGVAKVRVKDTWVVRSGCISVMT